MCFVAALSAPCNSKVTGMYIRCLSFELCTCHLMVLLCNLHLSKQHHETEVQRYTLLFEGQLEVLQLQCVLVTHLCLQQLIQSCTLPGSKACTLCSSWVTEIRVGSAVDQRAKSKGVPMPVADMQQYSMHKPLVHSGCDWTLISGCTGQGYPEVHRVVATRRF